MSRLLPSAKALFAFEAAARLCSFSRAATELNVTQPAVSQMLARLESHLEIRLFGRSAAGVELTEDGERLYRAVSGGFRAIEGALGEIRARGGGAETVTLSLSSAFTTHWLIPRMHRFRRAFPRTDLRFQLIAGPLCGPVEDVDLGMRFVAAEDPTYDAVLFVGETLLPVCSPAYHAAHEEGPDTLIHLAVGQPDWVETLERLTDARPGAATALSFSDYALVVQAALLGQGVALGWTSVASHLLREGQLVPAAGRALHTGRLCHLIASRRKKLRPQVADIRAWLLAEMRADLAELDRLYPNLGIGLDTLLP